MPVSLEQFIPTHNHLICFDSDGTVMNTMLVKHSQCLGPALIETWVLDAWEESVFQLWYDINLYQMTRGVNRFKALALALRMIHDTYTPIDGLPEYEAWVSSGAVLSGETLTSLVSSSSDTIFARVLHWNESVNSKIAEVKLSDKRPFLGATQGLEAASKFADIAVISTANRTALMEEWSEYGLLSYANVILAQDSGSKANCVAELLNKGYTPDHVLMVGDAPGDLEAAKANNVYFYPMLCRHEVESWVELREQGYGKFKSATYPEYGQQRINAFFHNLNAAQI